MKQMGEEEEEEDQSRDGWTVSTETWQLGTADDEIHNRTGRRRIVFAATTPSLRGRLQLSTFMKAYREYAF